MVKYGRSGHSRSARPHGRKATRRGSDGMKGYSRYASTGKGLSDIGQQAYNAAVRATLTTGYERYQFDVQQMLIPGTNTLRGMYQLPGSPEYAGGKGTFEARGMVGAQTTSYSPTPSGFGKASMGGMGRGEWERPQIPKEDAKGGAGVGTIAVLGGAAYLIWSILK